MVSLIQNNLNHYILIWSTYAVVLVKYFVFLEIFCHFRSNEWKPAIQCNNWRSVWLQVQSTVIGIRATAVWIITVSCPLCEALSRTFLVLHNIAQFSCVSVSPEFQAHSPQADRQEGRAEVGLWYSILRRVKPEGLTPELTHSGSSLKKERCY